MILSEKVDSLFAKWYNRIMYIHRTLEETVPQNVCSIDKLYSTYSYFYSKDFIFCGEYHTPWELVFIYSGNVIIETPEYKVTLSKNQAFLHSPNEKHKIRANNTCCSVFIYSFDCACDKIYDIAHKPLTLTPALINSLLIAVEEGLSVLAGKNHIPIRNLPIKFGGGQVIKNTLELTLISLIRTYAFGEEGKTIKTQFSKNRIVNLVVEYLEEHVQDKLVLNELAQSMGYSASHLSAIFHKETGISIKSYFNKLRIDAAKELLTKQTMSIQQISDYLNFDSVQYFSLRFKKETGLSPSQYISYLKAQPYYHTSL